MACSRECLEGTDKFTGAVSYLASIALLALGVFGFYQAARKWESENAATHDFSVFLAVQALFLTGGGVVCFLAEMRIPSLRSSVLSGCSFTWSRQGRGWFFIYLGLFSLFQPFDPQSPWITKTCGALQLLAGVLLASLAYCGGMREDLYAGYTGGISGAAAGSSAAARARAEQHEAEEWGGPAISKRHAPGDAEGGSGATPLRPAGGVVNPFLEAAKAAKAGDEEAQQRGSA